MIKCDDGQCYSIFTKINTRANCEQNRTLLNRIGYWDPAFPSQIFWKEIILQKSDGIEDTGYIVWQLLVALFVAWIIILVC